MPDLSRILSSARSDETLQVAITDYLRRDGFPQHLVFGLTFKEGGNDPPAFSLGFQLLNYPIGAVFVGENLSSVLPDDELEFVILHEVGHLVKNHLVASSLVWLGKSIVTDFLADTFKVSRKKAEEYLGILKSLYMLLSGKSTVEEDIKARMELEADRYAVNLQGRFEPAISCLTKLTGSDITVATHVTVDGNFAFPVVTAGQRIQAIRNP